MYTEAIDSLYKNDAVEGVALFNDYGELIENQLALSEDAVKKIGLSLNRVCSGLLSASRQLNGFLIKTDQYLLQAVIHQDIIILLQVEPSSSPNQNYINVKSQLGNTSIIQGAEQTPQPSQAATIQQPVFAQPVADQDPLTAYVQQPAAAAPVEENSSPEVDWAEFKGSLATLIKRVAPSGVANKMILNASISAGISLDQDMVELDTALTIGSNVVAKIPNAGRRKLIENEYNLLVKKFQV